MLVRNITRAHETSGDMIATRMADAVEKMEERQEVINTHTAQFVRHLGDLVSSSQSETSKTLQDSLTRLGDHVGSMLDSLRIAHDASLERNTSRQDTIAERTTTAVSEMAGSVHNAVKDMTDSSTRMQDAVARIANATSSNIERMIHGAETLHTASASFAKAGDRVSDTMGHAAAVTSTLVALTKAMTSSASVLQASTIDYQAQRDTIAHLVTELRAVVESAKTEASLTADVLSRIQAAADKLATAQIQADQYLAGVSSVLAEAHQRFADATVRTLDRANTEFHTKLTTAVRLLSSSIQELETTLGSRSGC
jgi:hypothetical protein